MKNIVSLLLLLLVGLLIYFPSLDILPYMAEGDTGRDLYAYEMTLEGKTPYRDYFYNYGPLMPYYYALCFKFFGIKIPSVLFGRMILNMLSGLFLFGCLRLFFRPILAIIGVWWFWSFNQDFTFTFNHTGGVCLLFLIMYALLQRLVDQKSWTTPVLAAALFLLLLVKVNIGMAAAFGAGISVVIINLAHRKRKFDSLPVIVGLPLFVAAIVYVIILSNLQSYFVWQSLPFMPGMEYSRTSPADTLRIFLNVIWSNAVGKPSMDKMSLFLKPWPYQLMLILGFYSVISLAVSWSGAKTKGEERPAKIALLMVSLFIVLMSHEYVISAVDYRIWWCSWVSFLGLFLAAGFMLERKPRFVKIGLALIVVGMILLELDGKYLYRQALKQQPEQFVAIERAQIHINNAPEWIDTLEQTTRRINELLEPQETFIILPYNPLYYFLSDHASPVPEVAYYAAQHVLEEQERRIIADLERKNNKWIIVSSRAYSSEPGLGIFGETYGLLLAQYLQDHFRVVETIGNWDAPPGWIVNNANRIYQREIPLRRPEAVKD